MFDATATSEGTGKMGHAVATSVLEKRDTAPSPESIGSTPMVYASSAANHLEGEGVPCRNRKQEGCRGQCHHKSGRAAGFPTNLITGSHSLGPRRPNRRCCCNCPGDTKGPQLLKL
ncbi:unnamed protein product [Ectocarpus sp. 12 AP-2014]